MRDQNTWHGIIDSISAPLGFFVLALLIVETFLASVLIFGKLSESNQFIGMLLGIGLFALLTIMVFLLVWHKPKNLTFDKSSYLAENNYLSLTSDNNFQKERSVTDSAKSEFDRVFSRLHFNAMCILYLFKIAHRKDKHIPLTIFQELKLINHDYAIGILNGLQAVEFIDFKIHKGEIITGMCSKAVEENIDGAIASVFRVVDEHTRVLLKSKIESIDEKFGVPKIST